MPALTEEDFEIDPVTGQPVPRRVPPMPAQFAMGNPAAMPKPPMPSMNDMPSGIPPMPEPAASIIAPQPPKYGPRTQEYMQRAEQIANKGTSKGDIARQIIAGIMSVSPRLRPAASMVSGDVGRQRQQEKLRSLGLLANEEQQREEFGQNTALRGVQITGLNSQRAAMDASRKLSDAARQQSGETAQQNALTSAIGRGAEAMPEMMTAPTRPGLPPSYLSPKSQTFPGSVQENITVGKTVHQLTTPPKHIQEERKKLVAPTPGTDVPFPEAVFKQKQALQARPETDTTDIKNYERAKKEGFKGTFMDWQRDEANRKKPSPGTEKKREITEEAIEAAAQSLAAGDLSRLRDIASFRNDQRLLIFHRARQLNPKFSTSEIDRKIKMEEGFATGKDSDNMRSFGIFLQHAGQASEAVNSVRLTKSPIINKPLNWLRLNATGDPAIQSFMAALEPVRKEFEGFLLGGRALYADDRRQAELILSENSSPAQIQAALKRMGHTAKARAEEMNFKYKRTMGRDIDQPFSPEAIEGAKQIGVDLGGQGSSSSHSAPANIITTPDGKKWKRMPDGSMVAQ